MSNKPIKYFYHDSCPHCKKMDRILENAPATLKNKIEKLSVADTRIKAMIASKYPNVSSVPTILFNDQVLSGTQAIDWVQQQIPKIKESMPLIKNNLMTKIVVGSLLVTAVWFFYVKRKNKMPTLE